MARPVLLVAAALLAGVFFCGCQQSTSGVPTGAVQPTVAGVPPVPYSGGEEARRAFTRSSDSLTAVLEDAIWLQYEGPPAEVAQAHRGYFEYGYTTFQVELRSKEFAQPTNETFVLEDSSGARLQGKPVTFDAAPGLVDDRFFTSFALSFPHMITRELSWIRLTRTADGSTVEWTFPGR